ncbi:MAG: galactokinase [Clostridiales bacterium]|nr:galactokinase [Clostridiales bacterium]
MRIDEVLMKINASDFDAVLAELYGESAVAFQRTRYEKAVESFKSVFPESVDADISIFSASGRTEICGNHTDHQHGRVLAAAVDLDTIALVTGNGRNVIRLQSEGYSFLEVDLGDLSPKEEEKGTTAALIRGVAACFADIGAEVRGFNAYVSSSVLSGSGLSSSAAFEVLIGKVIDCLFNGGTAGNEEIAKFGRIAENRYFGKACGLMDQMVSAVGGLVEIDFKDPTSPKIDAHQCNLDKLGFSLVITDTKGSHADLSEEYSAIPKEMRSVARFFGKDNLRDVDEKEFSARISRLKRDPEITDRAILRSAHFFADDARVRREAEALDKEDMKMFLELVNESGNSSETLLQNLYSTERPETQDIPLALLLSRKVLGKEGACRVHGGGFAGTIQAFVPKEKTGEYTEALEGAFGKGACHILRIRPKGAIQLI